MRNITELRQELAENFEKLKSGEREIKLGKELVNTAGKMINSLKIELDYNMFLEIKKPIKFLEQENTESKVD